MLFNGQLLVSFCKAKNKAISIFIHTIQLKLIVSKLNPFVLSYLACRLKIETLSNSVDVRLVPCLIE